MVDLDIYQQAPVDYDSSAVCIAGPGSGKTRVITSKAEQEFKAGQSVICLTFTRAAAQEIRDRIPGILAGTIHSFAHSVVGWEKDHDELLIRFLRAPSRSKFDWVLIDEAQDLTPEQMQVVLSLVKTNLFAVGDPFQSIYGWGGSIGIEILDMLKGIGCKDFYLKNNYRSTPYIVGGLNNIYSRDLHSAGTNENGITSILCRSKDTVNAVSDLLLSKEIGHIKKFGGTEKIFGNAQLRVATIHTCKGLEFSNVILHGWMPKRQRGKGLNPSSLDEETNVYYVAMSRAVSGYVETNTFDELLSALETFIPDLDKLRFSEDATDINHS